MEALTTSFAAKLAIPLLAWASAETGLAVDENEPVFFRVADRCAMQQEWLTQGAVGAHAKCDEDRPKPHAVYNWNTNTVTLGSHVDLSTLNGQAVLLHELVHHLQDVNDVKAACPAALERQAYAAMFLWLHKEKDIADPLDYLGINVQQLRAVTYC